jgi:chromosome partitioning protein
MDDFTSNMAKARRGYRSTPEFLKTLAYRKKQLRKWLAQDFDYTLVDCPPSFPFQVRVFLSVADRFIVPSIPDRLSVRGSLYLMDRVKSQGYKIRGLGTLWSLYRTQNPLYRKIVEGTAARKSPLDRLPPPFKTIIPNAAKIAEATDADGSPQTFRQKYSPQFAKLYEDLCQEIVKGAEWGQPADGQPATANV